MAKQENVTLKDLIVHCIKLHKDNNSRDAIAILNEVNQKYPTQPSVYDALATIYCDLSEFDRAIKMALARTSINADANAYKNLGLCYEKAGDIKEAAHNFTKSLSLQNTPQLAERLAKIKIAHGWFDNFEALLEFIEQHQIKESMYRLLEFALQHHRYNWVISIVKNELSQQASNLSLRLILAKALLHHNSKECIVLCQEILTEHKSELAETILAMAYTAAGETNRGIETLKSLRDRLPQDETVKINYSQALLKAGQFKLGYEHYIPEESNRSPFNLPIVPPKKDNNLSRTLICMDQGVGDQLRHSLFLKRLADQGFKSNVIIDPRLIPLLEFAAPGHQYYGRASDVPIQRLQQQCYGSQLGIIFHPELNAHPKEVADGWMSPPFSNISRRILPPSSTPFLGLAWRGAKRIAGRETWFPELTVIEKIIEHIDVHLIILNSQLNKAEQAWLDGLTMPYTTVDSLGLDATNDFLGMAKLINEIDVCLLPATAIAEQAAAFAKPTIFLGAEGSDRWSVSEIYRKAFHPNVRYFGKTDELHWDDQKEEIRQKLIELLLN